MNWYSFVYGFGTFVLAYMTYNLYVRSPSTETKFYFSLMGISATIWVLCEFFYYTLWGDITLLFYMIKYVGISLASYAIFMSTLTTPIRNRVMQFKYTPIIFLIPPLISIIFIFISPVDHLFFSGFKEIYVIDGHVRHTGIWGPLFFYWHLPYSYAYLMASLFILILNFRKSHTKIDYSLIITLFIALLFPIAANITRLLVRHIYPDPTSLSIIFSGSFMTYMLSKYKLFNVSPPNISKTSESTEFELGKNYIVNKGFYGVLKKIRNTTPLLIISIRDPQWIKMKLNTDISPVIWLSEVDTEESILPERIEFEIEYMAIKFLRENSGAVVIDGLGYLRGFNSFEKVIGFLKDVLDVASRNNSSVFLLNTDLWVMDENERKIVESLFGDTINSSEKIDYGKIGFLDDLKNLKEEYIMITPHNPEKMMISKNKSLWIKNRGERDRMKFEIIYEIEKAMSSGKNPVLHNVDTIFAGWNTEDIYIYLKLLVDLGIKYNVKIHILGKVINDDLNRIFKLFV